MNFNSITDISLYLDSIQDSYFYAISQKGSLGYDDAPEVLNELKLLIDQESKEEPDFSIKFEGVRVRCFRCPSTDGDIIIIRNPVHLTHSLMDCGISGWMRTALLDARLNAGGLVIITGKMGQGKTTTCSAFIKERLRLYGGQCIAIEDPVEIKLSGKHGAGHCIQWELKGDDATFAKAIKQSLRAYPSHGVSMMMLGEVRDPETAYLALNSAIDGRLVVVTMHASSPIVAIRRLLTLAAGMYSWDIARELMAGALRLVVHQTLHREDIGKDKLKTTLKIKMLQDTDVVGATIKTLGASDNLEQLTMEVSRQRKILEKGMSIEHRKVY